MDDMDDTDDTQTDVPDLSSSFGVGLKLLNREDNGDVDASELSNFDS